jgi:hypothetical protein
MAQVSLYLERAVFERVELAAQSDNLSISKYVANILKEHFEQDWPLGYSALFGSVTDDTFFPCGAESMATTEREPL